MIRYSRAENVINGQDARLKADIFAEAFPYIRRFAGRRIVVKTGGELLVNKDAAQSFAQDIVLLRSVGIQVVLVHGGGPQISETMKKFGVEPKFVEGQRITDEKTLEIAAMVLLGLVNRELVSLLNSFGNSAIGLSGIDGNILTVKQKDKTLGLVGDVETVITDPITRLLAGGYIPVISSLGSDAKGQAYNVNADVAAGALARALDAEKLILLTNVEGLYESFNDKSSLVSEIDSSSLNELKSSGKLTDGMIPKVDSILSAIEGGVSSAHILDGRTRHAVLLEIFTEKGIGTMVYP